MPLIKAITAALLILTVSLASAEQPLTGKQIQQWLNSIDEIQKWAEGQEALGDIPDGPNDPFTVEAMINQLKAANLYDEAEDVVEKSGFDSPEEWAEIQMRIVKAMISLEIEKENMNVDIQAQLDQIKNDPSIPPEQKEMMLNMMQSSMSMMQSMSNASPADKAAIKPYLPQIREKLDSDDMNN